MIIAIDGLAASGKTSVSAAVAKELGFACLNSGLLYRMITWAVLREGIDPADSVRIAERLKIWKFHVHVRDGVQIIQCEGHILGSELSLPAVNSAVSIVSQFPAVRRRVGSLLREIAAREDCVTEGRDMGTAVFPDAEYKFFLDASPAIRQKRRDAEGIVDAIQSRDERDRSRTSMAPDAVFVDTGLYDLAGVVNFIMTHVRSPRGDKDTGN